MAGFTGREALLNRRRGVAPPSRVRAVIEGAGLCAAPRLHAPLDPFDHNRATQAITLGAVVGPPRHAEGGSMARQPAAAGDAAVTPGVNAPPPLADRSAGRVCGPLDGIGGRVFGRRGAPAERPSRGVDRPEAGPGRDGG